MTATNLHRCQTCHLEHRHPKAHRAVTTMLIAITILALEVAVALNVTGWLALAMWLLIAWNLLRVILITYGLAALAVQADRTTP